MSYSQPQAAYGRLGGSSSSSPYQGQHSPASTHSSLHQAAPPPPPSPPGSFYVQALYAYSGVDTSSLSFRQGDVIEVLSTLASGWWDGVLCDQKVRGWFPSNYVQRISEDEATWAREQMNGFWDGSDDTDRRAGASSTADSFSSGVVEPFSELARARPYDSPRDRETTLEDLMAEDLTSFSSGADIFSEIAAAAQAESSGRAAIADYDEEGGRHAVRMVLEQMPDDAPPDDHGEDFWVPKVTQSGQLYYFNTRTSETSRDMPIDGQGDGVQVDHEEFPTDVGDESSPDLRMLGTAPTSDHSEWTTKLTSDGSAVYYLNERTGERSWSPPTVWINSSSPSVQSHSRNLNPADRASTGGASLLSAWTERTAGPDDDDGKADTLRRLSAYSDDSALDVEFEHGVSKGKGKEIDDLPQSAAASPGRDRKKSRHKGGRKAVSTAELLDPPPPPLINDLESLVTTALGDLISGAGVGGLRRGVNEDLDAQLVRDRLANLADVVVAAVRTLLHAAGVLEQVVTAANYGSSSASNEISGAQGPRGPTLPAAAQLELRPATRRVTSTLSKLVLTVRSAWGLLETLEIDQMLDADDGLGDEEEVARRERERELILSNWAQVRESRHEHESKLRSEVIAGARDVQTHVLAFLSEFERVVGESTTMSGGPPLPRALLRAPKALQGSLRTNAAALLLPGGGFGGNWRGNGFVTLPTPTSSPFIPVNTPGPDSLTYAYPSKPISPEVAVSLVASSSVLLEEADSLRDLVRCLADPSSTSTIVPASPSRQRTRSGSTSSLASMASRLSMSLSKSQLTPTPRSTTESPTLPSTDAPEAPTTRLLRRTTRLQRQIATFLTKVEDIDVAASVDFELPAENLSRPSSRREDFVSASGSLSTTESPKASDTESILDPPTSGYRTSVQEARPLLAELEIRKQALYDIAPSLLAALQELYMAPDGPGAFLTESPVPGPQPLSNSPLAYFVSPIRVEFGPETILEVISDLTAAVTGLCATITALGAIAEIQSTAPEGLRHQGNMAFRTSLFDGPLYDGTESPSVSSHADSRTNGRAPTFQSGYSKPPLSPSSSRVSLARTDDDSVTEFSSHSRDSIDSDFFFSKGANTSSQSSMGLSNKTAKLFGTPGGSYSRRPESVSSIGSRDQMRVNTEMGYSNSEFSGLSSPTRKKDLSKMLGKEAPRSLSSQTPDPSALGQNLVDAAPQWLDSDYAPDEVSFNLDKQVRGGTLRALIVAATSHEGRVDAHYLSAFLMTFRTFCTAHELLRLLAERYLVAPPYDLTDEEFRVWKARKQAPIQARVANVLKTWVREYMDHEDIDQDLLRGIAEFAQKQMGKGSAQTIQITNLVEERLRGNSINKRGNLAPGLPPPPVLPRNMRKLKFIELDPLEIARQLTIKDAALFSKITIQECLGKAWPKQFGSDAPNISTMIDLSNAITRWVTEMILADNDLKKRANTIKHFITIAEKCSELNNFSTLIHIIAGLNSTPIHRLRRTWETVNQKSMASLKALNAIMRPDKNYKQYREALRNVTPPCVPFLGVYLTDWTFIGDGNPDFLREKPHQINFNKRQKASELILMIKLHQATAYNLASVPQIRQLIDELLFPVGSNPATDDQRLYEISLSREPRERDDEKIARLLSESGFL